MAFVSNAGFVAFSVKRPVTVANCATRKLGLNDVGGGLMLAAMKQHPIYHSHPEILGGTPVFTGTRVPIQSLFDHLEAGESIDDFLEGFPSVKRAQVIALLEYSRQQLLPAA